MLSLTGSGTSQAFPGRLLTGTAALYIPHLQHLSGQFIDYDLQEGPRVRPPGCEATVTE